MKTLDEVIEGLQLESDANCHLREQNADALHYLKEYRDLRAILPDKCISYFGRLPVIRIGDRYFAVREYVAERKAWRCHQVEMSPITGTWVCNDDDNWIINNRAEILYREVGWDLREVPYEKQDSE